MQKGIRVDASRRAEILKSAIGRLEKALAMDTESIRTKNMLAHANFRLSRVLIGEDSRIALEEAIRLHREVACVAQGNASNTVWLAFALTALALDFPTASSLSALDFACNIFGATAPGIVDDGEFHLYWSTALILYSRELKPEDRKGTLKRAQEVAEKSLALEPQAGNFNLACIAALLGEFEKCHEHLALALSGGDPRLVQALNTDPDLESVRGESWYNDLKNLFKG